VLVPEAGNVRRELLALHGEVVVAEARSHPVRSSLRSARSGSAVGEVPGELRRKLHRRGTVEGGRKAGLLQRDRLADAERGDEQGHGHDEPGCPVDTA